MRIETDRLFLREMAMEDFSSLYKVLADSDIMQHYPYTFDETRVRSWIERNIERYRIFGFGLWAVVLKETGEFIGDCGITLQNIDGEMLPEIGYHIHKKYWRRGFAKEAARAVRDWVFKNTNYDAVYSYMKYTNVASYSTAIANGMKKVKEYPDPKNEISYAYAITRAEWLKKKRILGAVINNKGWELMEERATTTLFMLMSLDGKITDGANDDLDFDKDFLNIKGLKEGLHQYYEIEQTTDLWSLNSGRVQRKMGVNEKAMPEKSPVSFVLVDNRHLTEHGIKYFCARSKVFVLVTSNPDHPAYKVNAENLHIIFQKEFNPQELLQKLKADFGCERITIQTGGTLNSVFLREGLFDYVDIVIAPVLVGGSETATLIDGHSLTKVDELNKLGILQLQECKVLKDSYVRMRYKVVR